jgi:hypothetical protein
MDDWQDTPEPLPDFEPEEAGPAPADWRGPRRSDGDGHDEAFAADEDDDDGDPGSTIAIEFASGTVSADSIKIAGQVFNQNFHLLAGAGAAEPVHLSSRHFAFRTAEEVARCEAELIFETLEIEELRSSFEETRFLILTGEAEGGKGSLGLLLGSRLIHRLRGKGMLACHALGASVQVDLEEVAGDEAFGRQVVMLEDCLAGENADLRAFLKTLDPLRLATLQERLRKSSSAILLTAAASSLADLERRLDSLGILRTVAPPTADLRVRALRHFAARLPPHGSETAAVASFLAENEMEVARELKTIPRIARFVHEYLAEVVAGRLPLRQALSRMDDLSQWLTTDLAGDLDAQAAVLAIVVGSAVPPAPGMPWLAFDRLRRRITEVLRKELRIPHDQPSSPAGLGRAFLDRARAHVATVPSPAPDLVRFRNEGYPQILWRALVGPARELATLLIPLLREVALGSDPHLRPSAASALGRLGQIGPADLVAPQLKRWILQTSAREDLPGLFLQGSAGGDDKSYKEFCLAALREPALGTDAAAAEAAVRSLSFLGQPDPDVPIRELCGIVQARLSLQIDVLRQVDQEIVTKEESIRRVRNPRKVSSLLQSLYDQGHDWLIGAVVAEDQIRLLGAVQYALAGVLFSQGGGSGPVLRELAARMKAEPVKLAPLFAYLFLHRQGLIDLLDRNKWRSGAAGPAASRFLLASRPGERDPDALRDLMERIFAALETFPGFFRSLLEKRFFAILKSWMREGCEVIGLRPTVVLLLSALLASRNMALRRRMESFLETDPELSVRGSRLRALARDVRDGGGLEALPSPSARPRRLPAWLGK